MSFHTARQAHLPGHDFLGTNWESTDAGGSSSASTHTHPHHPAPGSELVPVRSAWSQK